MNSYFYPQSVNKLNCVFKKKKKKEPVVDCCIVDLLCVFYYSRNVELFSAGREFREPLASCKVSHNGRNYYLVLNLNVLINGIDLFKSSL